MRVVSFLRTSIKRIPDDQLNVMAELIEKEIDRRNEADKGQGVYDDKE